MYMSQWDDEMIGLWKALLAVSASVLDISDMPGRCSNQNVLDLWLALVPERKTPRAKIEACFDSAAPILWMLVLINRV